MRSAALIFSYVYNALPGKAAFENGLRSFWFFFSSCSCALQAIFQPSTMKPAAMAAPMRKNASPIIYIASCGCFTPYTSICGPDSGTARPRAHALLRCVRCPQGPRWCGSPSAPCRKRGRKGPCAQRRRAAHGRRPAQGGIRGAASRWEGAHCR